MTLIYTTVALVKKKSKYISADLLDPDIEEFGNQAEALIDATMKDSFLTSFDAAKHRLIRQCCTDITVFYALGYDPSSFFSLADLELTLNVLWNSAERALSILSDERTITYLKSL